jgi:hypothetical protein
MFKVQNRKIQCTKFEKLIHRIHSSTCPHKITEITLAVMFHSHSKMSTMSMYLLCGAYIHICIGSNYAQFFNLELQMSSFALIRNR